MRIWERFELGAIAVLTVAVWFSGPLLPGHMSVANLVLVFSDLLLAQSLIRDLAILLFQRKKAYVTPPKVGRCMCMESTVGAVGVVLGAGLAGFGLLSTKEMSRTHWALGALLVTVVGFLIRDLIFRWSPWRASRQKGHVNIIFIRKTPDT